jgi:hypothetical protein
MYFLHFQHVECTIHTLATVHTNTYVTLCLSYEIRFLPYINHACVYSDSNHFYMLICRKFQEDAT